MNILKKLNCVDFNKDIQEKTSFNPLSSPQNLLKAISEKLDNLKGFKCYNILMITEYETKISAISRNNFEEFSPITTHPINEETKKLLKAINIPHHKNTLRLLYNENGLIPFLQKITQWDLFDVIIPLQTEENSRIFLFLSILQEEIHILKTPPIFELAKYFQILLNGYETIKTEKELQELINSTREKQLSYELMIKKVEQVNEALSHLQEKQKKLIESERWISLSQITVTLNHEINNPLTLVLGMSQLLKAKTAKNITISEEEFKQSIISISEQCDRIVEIIKSLRRISVPVIEKYLPDIEMIKLDIKSKENLT